MQVVMGLADRITVLHYGRILAEGTSVTAAVSGGFLSVAGDRVSILAAQAQLSEEVDAEAARRELDAALTDSGAGPEEPAEAKYARARLRAAGDQA